jgi:hypothetical protein
MAEPYPLPTWLRLRRLKFAGFDSLFWNVVACLLFLNIAQDLSGVVVFAAVRYPIDYLLPSGHYIPCHTTCLGYM